MSLPFQLTFLFIVSVFCANAQTKHLIGIHVGFEGSYSPSTERMPIYGGLKANKLSHEGLSTGLLYRFQVKRFYVQTNPHYLNIGYGFESPKEIQKRYSFYESMNFTYHYVSIPLKVGFMFVNKEFKLGLDLGVSYNFRLKSSIHYIEQSPRDNIDERLSIVSNASYVSAHIGAVVGADIGKSCTLEFHPHYSHALSYSSSDFKINYLGIGVMFGYYLNRK